MVGVLLLVSTAISANGKTLKTHPYGCYMYDDLLRVRAAALTSQADTLALIKALEKRGRCKTILAGTEVFVERTSEDPDVNCVVARGEADCLWIHSKLPD